MSQSDNRRRTPFRNKDKILTETAKLDYIHAAHTGTALTRLGVSPPHH